MVAASKGFLVTAECAKGRKGEVGKEVGGRKRRGCAYQSQGQSAFVYFQEHWRQLPVAACLHSCNDRTPIKNTGQQCQLLEEHLLGYTWIRY